MYKVAYYARLPQNKNVVFTAHYAHKTELMEITIEAFLESEIPTHRVLLFKRDGEIIWDRKNKYTLI